MKIGVDFVGVSTSFYCNDGRGNYLLHKRGKNCRDEVGKWDPGGGKLEFGLTLEENVLKEVREEYGCEGTIQRKLAAYNLIRRKGRLETHWVVIPFLVLVKKSEVRNNEPEKIEEMGWFRINELPEPLHPGIFYTLKHNKEYLLDQS